MPRGCLLSPCESAFLIVVNRQGDSSPRYVAGTGTRSASASGNTPAGKAMKALPFTSPDILKEPDATLTAAIKNGKGKMPPFAGKLTDVQITDVVAYIHTLQKK